MRAWKFRVLTYSIAAIATCGDCLITLAASCREPAPLEVEADLLPQTRGALRETSAEPWQKPTLAPFAASATTTPAWRLEQSQSASESQKPLSGTRTVATTKTAGIEPISAKVKTAQTSEGRQLPVCEDREFVSSPAVFEAIEGDKKPSQASPPIVGTVVQVKWDAIAHTPHSIKVNRSGLAFQSEYCPFVLWNPSAPGEFLADSIVDSAPIGSCSDLNFIRSTAGHAQLASLPRSASAISSKSTSSIHADNLAELQQLCPDVASVQSLDAGENYLSELNQLLQGESNWLFANAGLLDLAPDDATASEDTYLEDLKGLVKHQGKSSAATGVVYRKTLARQEETILPGQSARGPQGLRSRYLQIAPEEKCLGSSGSGIGVLFEPMAKIQISGLSTAPPTRRESPDSEEPADLRRPENASCAYLDNSSPIYYFVPPRYGARRPPRGVHELYHQPLYFEDPNLERCGRSHGCLTTAVSAVYFGTAIAFTPYLTAATCPTSCVKSLPDCPTCQSFGHDAYWPGWSWKGAAAEAAAVTGLYFIVP
jgi:hypothetical protein